MTSNTPLHLAAALDGAGWHPAAWREPNSRPNELFTGAYWTDLAAVAQRGLLDFVTIEDSLAAPVNRHAPDAADSVDRVRARIDAHLVAARIAPLTRHLGLIPTITTTHTEPFHVSKGIATLDYTSRGRAGLQVKCPGTPTRPHTSAAAPSRNSPRRLDGHRGGRATAGVGRPVQRGRRLRRGRPPAVGQLGGRRGPSVTPPPPRCRTIGSPIPTRCRTEGFRSPDSIVVTVISTIDRGTDIMAL